MLLIVKVLQTPGKECQIEVTDEESIIAVKRMVAKEFDVPVHLQRLIFKGKTLADGQSLNFYKIGPGTKIHLAVRSTETDPDPTSVNNLGKCTELWDHLTTILNRHYTSEDSDRILEAFKKEFASSIANLSLDDIERLATSKLDALDGAGPSH